MPDKINRLTLFILSEDELGVIHAQPLNVVPPDGYRPGDYEYADLKNIALESLTAPPECEVLFARVEENVYVGSYPDCVSLAPGPPSRYGFTITCNQFSALLCSRNSNDIFGKLPYIHIKKRRANSGNLIGMKRAIMAIWKHRTGVHDDCGEWCPKETDLDKANKNKLPKFVTDQIKPIFEDLSANALLEKCLHGGTQNANESFYQLIWKRCPKTGFVGTQRLEIAVNDATIVYNNDELGRKKIFTSLGLELGFYSLRSFCDADKKRISSSLINSKKQLNRPGLKTITATCSGDARDGMYSAGGF